MEYNSLIVLTILWAEGLGRAVLLHSPGGSCWLLSHDGWVWCPWSLDGAGMSKVAPSLTCPEPLHSSLRPHSPCGSSSSRAPACGLPLQQDSHSSVSNCFQKQNTGAVTLPEAQVASIPNIPLENLSHGGSPHHDGGCARWC